MNIYIPTIGRRDNQKTAEMLAEAGIDFILVIPESEKKIKGYTCLPCPAKGIRATRQWILEQAKGKFIMMDDDLDFFIRSSDGKKFNRSTPKQVKMMCWSLEAMLKDYAHGGVLERFMAQTQPRKWKNNGKYLHVLCYNKNLFPNPHPKYELEVTEDMEMNLKLLTSGRPSCILTEYAADNVCYSTGGCNVWRTHKLEYQEHKKLEKMFPDLVKVIIEDPDKLKKNWNMKAQTNLKTRINWKKAYEQGVAQHPMRFPRD